MNKLATHVDSQNCKIIRAIRKNDKDNSFVVNFHRIHMDHETANQHIGVMEIVE